MEINLPPEVAAIIDRQLASGQCHSPTEVIVQALWLLDGWNDSEGERLEKLRQAAQEGLAGPFMPGQEALADLRAKATARRAGANVPVA